VRLSWSTEAFWARQQASDAGPRDRLGRLLNRAVCAQCGEFLLHGFVAHARCLPYQLSRAGLIAASDAGNVIVPSEIDDRSAETLENVVVSGRVEIDVGDEGVVDRDLVAHVGVEAEVAAFRRHVIQAQSRETPPLDCILADVRARDDTDEIDAV